MPQIPWSGDGLTVDPQVVIATGAVPDDLFRKAMVTTADEAVAAANRIGYPVMLKASEGGGGKGIRMSHSEPELRTNFVQVSNEVPGSPMFMMQLCTNARHLEVQIVGDKHGQAVALNGRDCSTQRRFQKIFEEGEPPIIAPPATFREMERAAQRLTQSIGYSGAGTVEYLFSAAENKFYFLELNPRLQVEHPVTEGIMNVNMPATQLQVAMGIPLHRIPHIRRLYGKPDAADGESAIDFFKDEYKPVDNHVIAARITAENPDEGFKPTSGSIERVGSRARPRCGATSRSRAHGGIHEFADAQFGHIFASGATREIARKNLVLALKSVEIRGHIRNPVEYLVQLAETPAFRENTIDTGWLDGIIREKSVAVPLDAPTTTLAAVRAPRVQRGVTHADQGLRRRAREGPARDGRRRRAERVPGRDRLRGLQVRVPREPRGGRRLRARHQRPDHRPKVRQQLPTARCSRASAGSRARSSGSRSPRARIVVDGATCLMPHVFDPSARTDVAGKVERFLHDAARTVDAGAPYVEVEAMKMIMPRKAEFAGAIRRRSRRLDHRRRRPARDARARRPVQGRQDRAGAFGGVGAPTRRDEVASARERALARGFETHDADALAEEPFAQRGRAVDDAARCSRSSTTSRWDRAFAAPRARRGHRRARCRAQGLGAAARVVARSLAAQAQRPRRAALCNSRSCASCAARAAATARPRRPRSSPSSRGSPRSRPRSTASSRAGDARRARRCGARCRVAAGRPARPPAEHLTSASSNKVRLPRATRSCRSTRAAVSAARGSATSSHGRRRAIKE